MKRFFILIVLIGSFIESNGQVIIKGRTVLKGAQDAMPGVQIALPGDTIQATSDADGRFFLTISAKYRYDIRFSFFEDMPTLQLINVIRLGRDTIDLGLIQMIPNKTISTSIQYRNQKQERKLKPIYHNANMIGYLVIDEVEAKNLLSPCSDPQGNQHRYPYDSQKNIITIDYQIIKDCR